MSKTQIDKLKEAAFKRAEQDCKEHGISIKSYATMLRDLADMLEYYESALTEDTTSQASADSTSTNDAAPARKGHIECKEIPKKLAGGKTKTYKYYYLRYWSEGKLKSQYLGKDDPRATNSTQQVENAA